MLEICSLLPMDIATLSSCDSSAAHFGNAFLVGAFLPVRHLPCRSGNHASLDLLLLVTYPSTRTALWYALACPPLPGARYISSRVLAPYRRGSRSRAGGRDHVAPFQLAHQNLTTGTESAKISADMIGAVPSCKIYSYSYIYQD